MLIKPGFTSFVLSSNIDQGGWGGISAQKRELVCHSCDCKVPNQNFLNNFVQDCSINLFRVSFSVLVTLLLHSIRVPFLKGILKIPFCKVVFQNHLKVLEKVKSFKNRLRSS